MSQSTLKLHHDPASALRENRSSLFEENCYNFYLNIENLFLENLSDRNIKSVMI